MSPDRPCVICEATARDIVSALQAADEIQPALLYGQEGQEVKVLTAILTYAQVEDAVTGLRQSIDSCKGICDVRNLLLILLTGQGPKLPNDEQPPLGFE